MYKIEFSKCAEKQFDKLEIDIQDRILKALERMSIRPYHFIDRLVGSQNYRLRVGDYRVIMDIQDNRLLIFVIEMRHRKEVYKR